MARIFSMLWGSPVFTITYSALLDFAIALAAGARLDRGRVTYRCAQTGTYRLGG